MCKLRVVLPCSFYGQLQEFTEIYDYFFHQGGMYLALLPMRFFYTIYLIILLELNRLHQYMYMCLDLIYDVFIIENIFL